jgi:A nuclease of the HNH/ENDO VII superfamily with conserved WHH
MSLKVNGLMPNHQPKTERKPVIKPKLVDKSKQKEQSIKHLAVRFNGDDETKPAKKTADDFLKEVLQKQPIKINDNNAKKELIAMKADKSADKMTKDDYDMSFRRAVYNKAMIGVKLSDADIKLADQTLRNAKLYNSHYDLNSSVKDLQDAQKTNGNLMPVNVGKENLEHAKLAGQAVLRFREYEAKNLDLAIEHGKNYVNNAMGGFIQPIVNAPVNIINGVSEPFRAGERMIFGTNNIPVIPRMEVAERSEYWNKDGRMYANKAAEVTATITFGGATGSKALATKGGRALLGLEASYNIASGTFGKDVTQTDENGNPRQMGSIERSLRVTGGIFGARQVVKTEVNTPNSLVNKLDDIFKPKPPQTEGITPEGFRVKVPQETKPLQTAQDLVLEARKKINSSYAEKDFPLQEYCKKMAAKNPHQAEFYNEVAKKYPNGVKFNVDGFPDFSPYSIKTVKVKGLTGEKSDFTLANKAAGYKKTPKDYTWHHNQDLKTMELVPFDLHYTVKHTGGTSKLKNPDAW